MTKLAFSSLFFSAVYSILHFNLLPVHGFPVKGNMMQDYCRGNQLEGPHRIYPQDGINHQLDNRIDRGRNIALGHDVKTAGNPLEDQLGQKYILPCAPTDEEREKIVERLQAVLEGVKEDEANEMIDTCYNDLEHYEQENLLLDDVEVYTSACHILHGLYLNPNSGHYRSSKF